MLRDNTSRRTPDRSTGSNAAGGIIVTIVETGADA